MANPAERKKIRKAASVESTGMGGTMMLGMLKLRNRAEIKA
jgi:hypothetical protein